MTLAFGSMLFAVLIIAGLGILAARTGKAKAGQKEPK